MSPEAAIEITDSLVPTAHVFVRHSVKCKDADKGESWHRCNCRKSIRVYDPRVQDPSKRQYKFSAKTRAWEKAEQVAQNYIDKFDPVKRELKALKAEKQSQTATIEEAVGRFLASKVAEHLAESTIDNIKCILGNVDPETFVVKRKGQLFNWLDKQTPRPTLVSDLTPILVENFRSYWNFGSDLTSTNAFTKLKNFFSFCRGKWIKENPMDGIKRPKVQKGSRTTIFTDDQYIAIVAAIKAQPTPDLASTQDNQRLLAFVELMRWGGLALVDAVQFKKDTLSDDGQLRYRRQKTKKLARPTLLPRAVNLLKNVPPVDGDSNQPFRDKNIKINSDKGRWRRKLKALFTAAGIDTVTTEIRDRDPHGHMFRDTFAVGQIRQGARVETVAAAIGDSVKTTLDHYLPWVQEMEKAHAEEQRRIVAAQAKLLEESTQADVLVIGGR